MPPLHTTIKIDLEVADKHSKDKGGKIIAKKLFFSEKMDIQ